MYVNQDTLDTSRQYAYLRHCDGEMTLIVANFGDQAVDTAVRIPQHALDCARMPDGSYTVQNLMDRHATASATIAGDTLFKVHIDANSFVMWKFFK